MEETLKARAPSAAMATQFPARCEFAARMVGLLAVAVGLLSLVSGRVVLLPGYPVMPLGPSLGFVLCGAALCLDHAGKTRRARYLIAQLCCGITSLLGAATLLQVFVGGDAGALAVLTAVDFLLLGGALSLRRTRRGFAVGQYLVATVGVVSLLAAIGYVYGIKDYYLLAFSTGNPMTVQTSLTLVALCAGALLSRPSWGFMATISSAAPGGLLARRLLPAALLIPLGAGWVRWQGEVHGLYGTAFGVALFTASNVLVFALLIWQCAHTLNRLDSKRAGAESDMRQLADLMPQIVWTTNSQGVADYYNQRCYDYNGLTFEQTRDGGWVAAIHPDDVGQVVDIRRRAFVNREAYTMEYRFRRASDGMYRWHLARGVPLLDPAGELVRWVGSCTDIHSIKMAKEDLRTSESQFHTLADFAPQIVWTATADGDIDYYNQRWYDYTGLDFQQCKDQGWQPMLHPDDAQKTLERWTQAFISREPYEMEFRLKRASDGMYRWHLGRAIQIRDAQGTVVRWFGTSTDIHALKSAEEAVRTSELQFKQLADSMPQMVWTAAPDGSIDYYNQRWHDYTGMNLEQTKNWGWAPVLHPDDLQNTINRWTTAVETCGHYEIEYRFKGTDGLYRWHLGRALPIRDKQGTVIRWFGTCTDIHEIKLSEEAFRRSELQFKELADAMPQIVWAATPDGNIDYANQRWQDYTGLNFEQTKNSGWHLLIHPDDANEAHQQRTAALTTCEAYQMEYRFKRVDGTYRWHLAQAKPIRDAHGTVIRWFGTCTDIEDYKQVESEIRLLNESLDKRVRERTMELDHANHQLALANVELRDFAAVASHDLQEPLRKVQAFGDRLKTAARGTMDAQGQDYLDRMLHATERMRSLIDDLLRLAHVSTQARPFLPVDLAQVTREVLADLEVRITETNALVEVGDLPTIQADALQMRQLLQNLIGNALKFHRKDIPPAVQVYAENLDGLLHLVVSDQGIGFDEEHCERIFAVFQRLHGRAEYEGTGVGLAICRKIAQRHGGDITATSAPGQGTRFVVALPLRNTPKKNSDADLTMLNAAINANPKNTVLY